MYLVQKMPTEPCRYALMETEKNREDRAKAQEKAEPLGAIASEFAEIRRLLMYYMIE